MATTSDKRQATSLSRVDKLREKLLRKLDELFELDQPDLDFGFYRIMHAKADEVRHFIEHDLLHIIDDAFGQNANNSIAKAKAEYEQALAQAESFGAPDPENTPAVRQAKTAYEQVRDRGSDEAQVYDHLYRFFERYYEDGDFISRRYYTRETAGQAAPYAIPYNGEEVKLHWANADQYYIKSTEYFNNFTFDLALAPELQKTERKDQASLDLGDDTRPTGPLRVHFQITDADEGEHNNVKATDDKKRDFFLHQSTPVALNSANELVVNFEYRAAEKSDEPNKAQEKALKEAFDAKNANKGDLPNLFIAHQVLEALKELPGLDPAYLTYLTTPAPTDKIGRRPLLVKYLNNYTRRNTADYFIHKDLSTFLRRELDFYIKNEVMRLDDIENADAPTVESYLSKIKVLRQIAHKLIDFLGQLEDFQKKLWLKKKFVTETNYCITLDRVPRSLYPQIATNDAQHQEWVDLFAIDEIKGDLSEPGYTRPLTLKFLEAHQNLVLDTQFFDAEFTAELIESIDDFDEQCDGLLIHSENFQALQLLQERYREQVKCVHIDPPYNTSDNAFLYKNTYKHSSWLALIENPLRTSKTILHSSGVFIGCIDDTEHSNLKNLLSDYFGESNYVSTIAVEINPAGQNIRPNAPARSHDYFHIFAKNINSVTLILRALTAKERKSYTESDAKGRFYWDNLRRRGGNSRPSDRPKQWFPLFSENTRVRVPQMTWNEQAKEWVVLEKPKANENIIWPVDPKGEKRIWRVNPDGARLRINRQDIAVIEKANRKEISLKSREPEGRKPKTLWSNSKYSATSHGTKLLIDILGNGFHFSYPKSIHLTTDALRYWVDHDAITLDYFAGSGTTGHAVLNLNREDDGQRKYILCEMGDYFDTVLKPRLAKVAYAKDWKNGKPVARDTGISHCFKYIRLESYEDTLNNLRFKDDPVRQRALANNAALKEDYMLNYMLDVETRGSQSLLNIDQFNDPTKYSLELKQPGSDARQEQVIDLIETFNYLIGLRVEHMAAPQRFTATFTREIDDEAPEDQTTRLILDERLTEDEQGRWWLRKIEGWVPADPANPNNGLKDRVLIIWRNLTGDLEQDNLVLDEYFKALRINTRDFEYDTIYVNGSNNLPNLKTADDQWKVRLLEEEFHRRMWDTEN